MDWHPSDFCEANALAVFISGESSVETYFAGYIWNLLLDVSIQNYEKPSSIRPFRSIAGIMWNIQVDQWNITIYPDPSRNYGIFPTWPTWCGYLLIQLSISTNNTGWILLDVISDGDWRELLGTMVVSRCIHIPYSCFWLGPIQHWSWKQSENVRHGLNL